MSRLFSLIFPNMLALRPFVIFCLFGGVLSVIRVGLSGNTDHMGLVWNLILALIPYFFALIYVREKRKWHTIFFPFLAPLLSE